MPLEMGQPINITMGPEVAALNCGSGLALAAGIMSLRGGRQDYLRLLHLDPKGVPCGLFALLTTFIVT